MILSEDRAQFDWSLTPISPASTNRSLTDSCSCQQITMGNEKCIPFSALAFPASFILKYHTLLLLLPLAPHLSFPLEMSVFFSCMHSDLNVTSSLCVRFLQQLYAWIQDEQSLTGGLPYRHTGGEPQRRVTVKSAPRRNAL